MTICLTRPFTNWTINNKEETLIQIVLWLVLLKHALIKIVCTTHCYCNIQKFMKISANIEVHLKVQHVIIGYILPIMFRTIVRYLFNFLPAASSFFVSPLNSYNLIDLIVKFSKIYPAIILLKKNSSNYCILEVWIKDKLFLQKADERFFKLFINLTSSTFILSLGLAKFQSSLKTGIISTPIFF